MFTYGRKHIGYGRQVLTPGHHRRTPIPRVVNINVKNIYGNLFQQRAHYCQHTHDCGGGGMGTLGTIMTFLGLGGSLLGSFFGAHQDSMYDENIGGNPHNGNEPQTVDQTIDPQIQEKLAQIEANNKKIEAYQKKLEEIQQAKQQNTQNNGNITGNEKDPTKQNSTNPVNGKTGNNQANGTGNTDGVDDPSKTNGTDPNKAKNEPNYGAKYKENTTRTFNVTATATGNVKDGKKEYEGYTGYDIVSAFYLNDKGEKLSSTEIKNICKELFKGKALAVGELNLPGTVVVNGKTYNLNKDAKDTDVQKTKYTLGSYEVHTNGAIQKDGYWIATKDGKELPELGKFKTEDEAKAAAKKTDEEIKG